MSASSPAPLRVLFLGPLRDRVGRESAEISFPDDGTQSSLWDALDEQFPSLQVAGGTLRLARGDEFLAVHEALQPGDEIALIPPVSGG